MLWAQCYLLDIDVHAGCVVCGLCESDDGLEGDMDYDYEGVEEEQRGIGIE